MISVIVPCFNSNTLKLQRCMESIDRQTYKDTEVIVVDDGSDYKNAAENERLVSGFDNTVFVKTQHGGLSHARNTGIKKAKGEYITFVDSDDYISNRMLENLHRTATENEADVVLGYIMQTRKGTDYVFSEKTGMAYVVENKDKDKLALIGFSKKQDSYGFLSCGPCGALYQSDIVKECLFPTTLEVFEDVYWNVLMLRKSKRTMALRETVYVYDYNEDSITHTWSIDMIDKRIKALKMIEGLIDYVELRPWYGIRLLSNYYAIVSCIMITPELQSKTDRFEYARRVTENPIWSTLHTPGISRSWNLRNRIKLALFKSGVIIPALFYRYSE